MSHRRSPVQLRLVDGPAYPREANFIRDDLTLARRTCASVTMCPCFIAGKLVRKAALALARTGLRLLLTSETDVRFFFSSSLDFVERNRSHLQRCHISRYRRVDCLGKRVHLCRFCRRAVVAMHGKSCDTMSRRAILARLWTVSRRRRRGYWYTCDSGTGDSKEPTF